MSTGARAGLIIAAPASGSGKTSVTLGLLRALRNRGLAVHAAKVGPDYIDPQFHKAACGRTSYNLDTWAMRAELLQAVLANTQQDGDVTIIEGVMGLFDGAQHEGESGCGSTAELARRTGLPVALIINCQGFAQSVAALARGFRDFDPAIKFAGVILNRVTSPRHGAMLRAALTSEDITVLGTVPRSKTIELPSRHLGLVQAEELADLDNVIDGLAELVEANCDIDLILAQSQISNTDKVGTPGALPISIPALGGHIAVAEDAAFRFAYPHVLDAWGRAGTKITTFSPLADMAPDAAADAIYLPGGYPELHGRQLAGASQFLGGLCRAASEGKVIYGECGGYMVLGNGLVDGDGTRHEMAGLLDLETSFADRSLHLGYRDVETVAPFTPIPQGSRFRAHEFHYASIVHEAGQPLFVNQRDGKHHGLVRGTVAGSFIHLIDCAQ